MKKMLLLAGTTEGRRLSEHLAASKVAHTVCVATEYGEIVMKENPMVNIHVGRMDREQMLAYLRRERFEIVVDATHPYAKEVTENIRAAAGEAGIPCLRLQRDTEADSDEPGVLHFDTNEACARALGQIEGNILLTTGSKELSVYCQDPALRERLYARVLPGIESIRLCMENGIAGKQILALQGPFTTQMNEAIIRQYQIRCIVTKQSGSAGGYPEKLEAAARQGIMACVIGRPQVQEGMSYQEVCLELEKQCGVKLQQENALEILLAGIGMGDRRTMTGEVQEELQRADYVFGASRMLAGLSQQSNAKPYYMPEQVIPCLHEIQEEEQGQAVKRALLLFSGDSGFYSGCQNMYKALQEEIKSGRLRASVRILPGISSIAYLAAAAGESYQDAKIYSLHGTGLTGIVGKVQRSAKTFFLLSGVKDVNYLGRLLEEAGLSGCEIVLGYQLSYPEEQILHLTPGECRERKETGLYTCLVKNPRAGRKRLTHGMAEEAFSRGKVPMTKEEVREVSICKLGLFEGAVVYDIGSGTGSVAVEVAALSDTLQVYAIERKPEAIALTRENCLKYHLDNITVVEGEAPEAFHDLPVPTHAFIGGSGGRLSELLTALYEANPTMRVVVNAVSLETISELTKLVKSYPTEQEEIVQLQASRAVMAGSYHLMRAENPVYICSFTFRELGDKEEQDEA